MLAHKWSIAALGSQVILDRREAGQHLVTCNLSAHGPRMGRIHKENQDWIPSPLRGSRMTGDKLEDLEKQMKEAAARLDFEEAARLRDIIRGMK